MFTNQSVLRLYPFIKVLTASLLLGGSVILIIGITEHNKGMITGSTISIIASAFLGVGIVLSTRNNRTPIIKNDINMNNPLLSSNV
jgi:ABC-type Mn2+/Zn2+ transport system permease subunit